LAKASVILRRAGPPGLLLNLDQSRDHGYIYSHCLKEGCVTTYSVADAKNTLPKLIDRALQGEEVVITRRGKPVAELRPASRRTAPAVGTHEWLRARTRARPGIGLTSVELLDLMYESQED
jgi:prevent-host-death family protein